MRTRPINRLRCLIIILSFALLTPLTGFAAAYQWNGSGPFATGQGDRVITALAATDDGSAVFAGTGSGTVFRLTEAFSVIGVVKGGAGSGTVTTTDCSFEWGVSGGSCVADPATPVTLTATAVPGSTFTGWSGGAGSAVACTGTGTCAFTAGQDSSVTANFVLNQYTVTPAAGANGTITPKSPQTVTYGAVTKFTLAPDPHYHIVSATGCNGSLSGNTYTTGVFPGDCTVSAAFAIDTFTVTPSAGSNGSISPSSSQSVNYNGSASFTVKPAAGYNIAVLTGCGGSYSGSLTDPVNGVTYTTGAVTANCTVSAVFSNYAPPADGLVAWWNGQDNAVDSVGGHDGSATNVTYAAGKVGDAFSFSGSSSYVTIPDSSVFDFTGRPFVIAAWVNIANGSASFGTIFDRSRSGYADGYRLDYAPGTHTFRLLGTTSLTTTAATLTPGTWYHVAAVADGAGNATIYVNGVAVASGGYATNSWAVPPRIGDCQTDNQAPFNGLIDEVQIYNRALAATEILSVYNQYAGFYDVAVTGGASTHGAWSGGSPDVWTPDNSGSTVAASEILSRLNSGIGVTINTTGAGGAGTEHGDVTIAAPLPWSVSQLKLLAGRDVNINAVMTASGSSTLALAATSGTVKTGGGGRVDFDRTGSGLLTINGAGYAVVNDAAALQDIASGLTGNYALGANFDAASITNFVPLGNATTPFTGNFDGLGHTISGLTISRPTTDYVGLFGYTSGSALRNVGLVGGDIAGQNYVGGLAGYNQGTINHTYSSANVTAYNYTGGLVGWHVSGAIGDSFSSGAVSGNYQVGGLVGVNNKYTDSGCTISNAYSSGAVTAADAVGGVAGSNYGLLNNVYASGRITASTRVGGLVGYLNVDQGGSVTNSFWDADSTTRSTGYATLVNTASRTGIWTGNAPLYSTTTPTTAFTSAGYTGWNISNTAGSDAVWRIYEGQTYPQLRSFLAPLTITAADMTKPYDAIPFSGGNGLSYVPSDYDAAKLSGTPSYGGTSQGGTAVGSYSIIPYGVYSKPAGYDIDWQSGTLTIAAPSVTTVAATGVTTGAAVLNGTVNANNISSSISFDYGTTTAYGSSAAATPATVSGASDTAVSASLTGLIAGQVYHFRVVAVTGGSTVYGLDQSFTTSRLNQSLSVITLAPATLAVNGAATVSATATSGLAVAFASLTPDVCSVSNTTVSGLTAGTCTISASQPGNAMYWAVSATKDITVAKASQTITLAATVAKTYGGADFGPGASASSGLEVGYASSDTTVATIVTDGSGHQLIHLAGTGSATITASQAGNADYQAASADMTLTVNKAVLTVTADNKSRAVGDPNPPFSATYSGFVNGEDATVITGAPTFSTTADGSSPAGSYPITPALGTLEATNYDFTFVDGTLAVNLTSQNISFASLPAKTYGDPSFTLTATSDAPGLTASITYTSTNPAVATVSGATVTIVAPGTTTIVASQPGDATHASATAQQTLTVNKAILTVTAQNASRAYYTANPVFTATYSGFVNGETEAALRAATTLSGSPSLTTIASQASPVAGYPIQAAPGTLAAANYDFAFADGTLAVGLASQNIAFAPLAVVTYGAAPFVLTATGGDSGNPVTFASSDPAVATVTGETVAITGAGTVTITASQAGSANYASATVQQTLTVNKAPLVVIALDAIRAYGEANPVFTATYSGFVNNEDATVLSGAPTLTTTATAASPAADYPITAAVGTLFSNKYSFLYYNGTLTVGKIVAAVSLSNLSQTYDGSAKTPTVTTTPAGLGVIITYNGSTTAPANAGNYTVVATVSDANYQGSASSLLVIDKGTAGITLGNLSATYDGTAKAATATTTPSVLGVTITYDGSAAAPSYAGSYAVIATVSDGNWQGTASGTLVIDKGTAVVILGDLAATYDGTAKAVTASTIPAGLGYSVTYNGSNTVPIGVGSYAVVATIGDTNYQGSATSILVIAKATPTITWDTPAAIASGTALSGTQLNATASVAGSFSYAPAAGTVLGAGSQILSVTFTPDDGNYGSATAFVTLTVTAAAGTTPPTVDTFVIPGTLTSLTCPINSFTASGANGVTGYLVSENSSQPATDAAWSTTAPAEYAFASQGTKTLYAFAKDAAGNVSVPLSASVTITMADTTPPTVTGFSIPATAATLTVAVSSFIASDDTGVSARLLSETASVTAGDSRWATALPSDYTFTSQGSKTLYAFAKDAAGNVSAPLSAAVVITLPDITAPVVTAFAIPSGSATLIVAVNSFTASDDVGVTGYLVSESGGQPAANAAGWSATAPSVYTFSSQGNKTLYAFAKDAAGNVSAPALATVLVTLPDNTAPTVDIFTLPVTSNSLTVAVASFTASDDVGVTGYLLTESATATASSGNWTATPTSSYTFATAGAKTLYAFAKDAAGNVSAAAGAVVSITLPDITAPIITGFSVTGTSGLTVTVSSFTATDDTAVTGYIITESSTAPDAAAGGWSSTPPASYTCVTGGSKMLYAYAKDAAGNVSAAAQAAVNVASNDGSSGFTIVDALVALQIAVGSITPTPAQIARLDVAPLVNGVSVGDGKVDVEDALVILYKVVGIIK